MKTSIILVGMTLTMLLLALPVGAADYTLGIFGNANEDDEINMVDVTYTELIIMERVDETQLADGKYDDEIDILDVTQIELIILGREKELTLLDSANRIVTVQKPVERIVTTHVSNAEAISLLGAWDMVVGRDYYITDEILFPGVSELPVVTGIMGCYDVDFENVFELDPDIFLTLYIPYNPGLEDVVATLEPEIPVVTLNFEDPATLAENIKKLRYVLNTKEEGDEFIAFYEGVVNEITEKTAGLSEEEKTRVFLWMFNYDYQDQYMAVAGDWTGIQSQFEIVGGINIAEDLVGWYPVVGDEWLLAQSEDPGIDVILCWVAHSIIPGIVGYDVDDTTVARETRDWIIDADENPVLADSSAVKDGRVYLYQIGMVPTPRFVVSLPYLAKWLHPDLFEDLDPQAIHQQYLTDFLRIDYDLDEHGVFVYPEP